MKSGPLDRLTKWTMASTHGLLVLLIAGITLAVSGPALAQSKTLLEGNFISNPSFEFDRHHDEAEGHAIAFMGDWSFNASDLRPDYCFPQGNWSYARGVAHTGNHSLLLKTGGAITRGAIKAGTKGKAGGGDSRWGNPGAAVMKFEPASRLASTVRASLWYQSKTLGGDKRLVLTIRSCNVTKSVTAEKNTPGNQWARLDVELTKKEIETAHAEGKAQGVQMDQWVSAKVEGDAQVYVDDISMSDALTGPTLAPNAGFEAVNSEGYPEGWSLPKKYRFYTQQYYKWTSWNHFFDAIRGPVRTTDLISHSGQRSLLMQVYPGDEMLVEGSFVPLKQTKPGIVQIGAYVRIDRIKWIDIRAVDQDGNEIPCVDAFTGGWPIPKDNSQLYPSNAANWLYVRKPFLTDKPLKGLRPRLCARGFNGDTRDDGGTRANVNQVGLVWWDDVQVNEITATPAELKARGVKPPAQKAAAKTVMVQSVDLGDRMHGDNKATFVLHNPTGRADVAQLSFAVVGSERPPATAKVTVAAGGTKTVTLPYRFEADQARGTWQEQGMLQLDLTVAGKSRSQMFAYNTWPVVVDVDMSRHYALASENPQTFTLNFGVASETLSQAKSLKIEIRRLRDDTVVDTVRIADLPKAMTATLAALGGFAKAQFGTPNPAQYSDRKNLLAVSLNLSKVPPRPFDHPVRDHYLKIVGLDAKGQELFADTSQKFGRVHPNTEKLPKITSTKVRQDGAVLINGKPVFMMAGNGYITGNFIRPYTPGKGGLSPAQNKTMGFNSIRWVENIKAAETNWAANLYSLETMVSKGRVNAPALAQTKADLAKWKQAGLLDGVVTLSPYYEHSVRFNGKPQTPAEIALDKQYTQIANSVANRISNFGAGGAHTIYTIDLAFDSFDSFGLEIEPFGPPRGGYELAPLLRKGGKAWFHLPQTYSNTPFDFFRFDQYVMILQGGRGFSTIHGLGDPSLMRGITGEIRHLSPAIFSADHGDKSTKSSTDIWWMQRKVDKKTTIIALNKPAVEIGQWTWSDDSDAPDGRSHTGMSQFTPNPMPDGLRLHGFRETRPVVIQAGDKLVQYVRVDSAKPPTAISWGVRGDAKWDFNAHYGRAFDFAKWRKQSVNFWLAGELLPGSWQVSWAYNDTTNNIFADLVLHPKTFKVSAALPPKGEWTRLEMDADKIGLVGKQIDGFFFIAKDGDAQWSHSAVVRGKDEIVVCGSSLGPSREELAAVRFEVPWAVDGTKVRVLFEERDLVVKDGAFVDDFSGEDFFQTVRGGATGDALGWHAPGTALKAQTIGYVTPSGPAAVHVYEILPGAK